MQKKAAGTIEGEIWVRTRTHWVQSYAQVSDGRVLHREAARGDDWQTFVLGEEFSISFGIRSKFRGYFVSIETAEKNQLRFALEDKEDLDDWVMALQGCGNAKLHNRELLYTSEFNEHRTQPDLKLEEDDASDAPVGKMRDEEEESKTVEIDPQLVALEEELHKVPQDEHELIRRGRKRAFELEQQQHSEQWVFLKEKNATKMWAFRAKDGSFCVKSERTVHYSVDEIVQALDSFEFEKKVNDKTGDMRLVKQYGLNQQVFYVKMLTPVFVSTRDICQLRHRYVNSKGQTVIAVYSEEHPDVPLVKKNVRAEMDTSGYIMTPLADGSTHVVNQLKINLKISPPKFLIDQFNRKQGYRLLEMEQALDEIKKNMKKRKRKKKKKRILFQSLQTINQNLLKRKII